MGLRRFISDLEIGSSGIDMGTNDITNAGSISTDDRDINDLSAALEKTSNQSISQSTDTTVDWDNQKLDTDQYTYNTSTDEIDVLSAGDYSVKGQVSGSSLSAGDNLTLKILVNGAEIRRIQGFAEGNNGFIHIPVQLRDLSANDTIRFDFRTASSSGCTIDGDSAFTYLTISKEG